MHLETVYSNERVDDLERVRKIYDECVRMDGDWYFNNSYYLAFYHSV